MDFALKAYIGRSRTIFDEYHTELSKVVTILGISEPNQDDRRLFEEAIKEAEDTKEFVAFAKALEAGPLAHYLKKLDISEEKRTKKQQGKPRDIDKLKHKTERHATKAFFRNTGTYFNLWYGKDIDESRLVSILNNYSHESELIRLFVFDGFVPCHEKKTVDKKKGTGEL